MSEKNLVGYYTSRYSGEEIDRMLAGFSNPNLLDNWYFVGGGSQQGGGQFPLNQRASVAYGSGNGEYFIDRWRINGSCELMPDGLLLKPATLICQFFEEQLKQYLDGKLVTASIWFEDGTYYFGSSVYHKASSANTTLCSLPGAFAALIGSDGNFYLRADYTSVDGIKPGAVKLELGSAPTLAHQDTSGNWVLNDLPNYQQELAKCQRYYWKSDMIYASATFYGNLYLICNVVFPVKMRTTPAVAIIAPDGTLYKVGIWANSVTVDLPATPNVLNADGFDSIYFGGGSIDTNNIYAFRVAASADV